jgi:hypothetical protein
LGSDGGFSIDLGNGRVLWSFGDTLVVKKAGDTRKTAAFVHNTVAIETGYDPSTAQMKYYRRRWGSRMEIFPSEGRVRMWPSHGIRIGNRLVVFCSRIQNNPKKEDPPRPKKAGTSNERSKSVCFRIVKPACTIMLRYFLPRGSNEV